MKKIVASGKSYDLHSFSGKVLKAEKSRSTEVYGGGNANSGVSIGSRNTVHDDIFLVSEDGSEQSFQLVDFDVACREGNSLKIIWAIKQGDQTGSYIVVINQTTSRTYFSDRNVKMMFRPGNVFLFIVKWTFITAIACQLFLGFVFARPHAYHNESIFERYPAFFFGILIGVWVAVNIFKYVIRKRAAKFQKEFSD